MSENPDENPESTDKGFTQEDQQTHLSDSAWVWHSFLNSRGVQDLIAGINDLVKDRNKWVSSTNKWRTFWGLFWILMIVLAITIPVFFLRMNDMIGSDAVAFLLGTIVGASFTFLRNFLSGDD